MPDIFIINYQLKKQTRILKYIENELHPTYSSHLGVVLHHRFSSMTSLLRNFHILGTILKRVLSDRSYQKIRHHKQIYMIVQWQHQIEVFSECHSLQIAIHGDNEVAQVGNFKEICIIITACHNKHTVIVKPLC